MLCASGPLGVQLGVSAAALVPLSVGRGSIQVVTLVGPPLGPGARLIPIVERQLSLRSFASRYGTRFRIYRVGLPSCVETVNEIKSRTRKHGKGGNTLNSSGTATRVLLKPRRPSPSPPSSLRCVSFCCVRLTLRQAVRTLLTPLAGHDS